jgi:hypothetical protein
MLENNYSCFVQYQQLIATDLKVNSDIITEF